MKREIVAAFSVAAIGMMVIYASGGGSLDVSAAAAGLLAILAAALVLRITRTSTREYKGMPLRPTTTAKNKFVTSSRGILPTGLPDPLDEGWEPPL